MELGRNLRWIFVTIPLLALLGCGGKTDAEFKALVEKAQNDLLTKSSSQEAAWGFGKATRWDLNQDAGDIFMTFGVPKIQKKSSP